MTASSRLQLSQGLAAVTAAKATTVTAAIAATTVAVAAAEAATVTTAKATTATAVGHAVYAGAHRIRLATIAAARAVVASMTLLSAQVCISAWGLVVIPAAAFAVTKLARVVALGCARLVVVVRAGCALALAKLWLALLLVTIRAALSTTLGVAVKTAVRIAAIAAFCALLALRAWAAEAAVAARFVLACRALLGFAFGLALAVR